ncbi:MAG: hypothetical protein ACTSVC_08455 [Promethearchaeota archaeon]
MVTNQMFKKYLLKRNFWQTRSKKSSNWYVRHSMEAGGIYAKILDNQPGVEIIFNNKRRIFHNFTELEEFLNNIDSKAGLTSEQPFISLLNRKMTSKVLRTLPL